MKFIVIGGAGAMGSIVVRDLVQFSRPGDRIIIADASATKASRFARALKSSKVSARFVNARDPASLAAALKGGFAVINCAPYQFNLEVMRAALKARVHYVDLGGLFHMTRKQLKLHRGFKEAGLLALIGMGAAPGITNILARQAADRMERVQEIHARVASEDRTRYSWKPALPVSYSLQTILEEFSLRPAVFRKGRFVFVEPMSGAHPHRFAGPVGIKCPMYTIHSEVATLPLSFRKKGVKEVSFKIAFEPDFVDRVRFLRDLGLASHEAVSIRDHAVRPIELVNSVAMAQAPARGIGRPRQHEIVRTIVKGVENGKRVTYILDCHTRGMPEWGVGTDINTGTPPAIAALMLARGEIRNQGVLPPETAVPPEPFFRHLKKRRMWVETKRRTGWELST